VNDETDKLRRQLEAATAPGDVPDEPLDAETESLRQGWHALGRLLEAAEGPLAEPGGRWRAPVAQRRPRWRPATLAAVAVAASLLVAVAVAWSLRSARSGNPPLPSPEQVASQKPAPPPTVGPDRTHAARQKRAPSKAAELKWDDSLDQQLVSAGQELVRIQQQWYAQGGGIDYVRHGLNQMEEEFNDDPL
jgi:hypothetical protein